MPLLSVTAPRRRMRRTSAERAAAAGQPFPLRRRQRSRLPFARDLSLTSVLIAVFGLTLLGAAIRLSVTRDLSVDELLVLGDAQRSFSGLISLLIHRGTHPPLQPVLEWCVVHLFGSGRTTVRLPSLVAGIALVPAVAALAGEVFDRRTAVVACALACLAPALVWYSQDDSSYALVALFGTLSILGAARAARTAAPVDFGLHVVAGALAVWSDWSGILILLATELFLVAGRSDRRAQATAQRPYAQRWALDTAALAVQLVVLGLLFASQLHGDGGLGGLTNVAASGVSFYSSVSNVAWGLFGFHPSAVTSVLSAVWPLAMLGSLLLVGRGSSRPGWLLLGCCLIPAVGVFVLGLVAPASYDVRYGLAAVPPAMVLLARLIVAWPRERLGRLLIGLGAIALLAGALIDQQIDSNNPRLFAFGPALARMRQEAGGRSARVLYAPANLRIVLARDGDGLASGPLTHSLPTRRQAANVFVLTSSGHGAATQQLLNRELGALRATRHLAGFHADPGVDVWWFR